MEHTRIWGREASCLLNEMGLSLFFWVRVFVWIVWKHLVNSKNYLIRQYHDVSESVKETERETTTEQCVYQLWY